MRDFQRGGELEIVTVQNGWIVKPPYRIDLGYQETKEIRVFISSSDLAAYVSSWAEEGRKAEIDQKGAS